jgi:hypothetical protein
MNHSIDQSLLDRMVDGQLREPERNMLLEELDQTPDGWRCLALAYVEAGTWAADFRDFVGPEQGHLAAAVAPVSRPARSGRPIARWAMVVGLLVAVASGFALRGLWTISPASDHANDTAQSRSVTEDPLVGSPSPSKLKTVTPTRQETVTLLVNAGASDALERIEIPLLDAADVEEDWFHASQRAIPQQLLEEFQQQGRQVRTGRTFHQLTLGDGRRIVVPIDSIEVQSMDQNQFQ